ncbi:hypothetical protein HQ496_03665 [bacterium]|nr:hypothetical protein [bacterium]
MKRTIVIILLCIAAGPASGRQVTGRQVTGSEVSGSEVSEWDRSEIMTRGSVGLPELLRTLEPMRYWSTDRFSLRLVDSGMGGAHARGPSIVVDNLPMTSPFFDRTPYELVPLLSSDIASITLRSGLDVLDNGDLTDGIIEITTLRPKGFSIRGAVGLTNETGDPGPAIYSNAEAKNVDRSGPTAGLRMSWGSENVYVQAGFDTDSYHMTDERLDRRIWRLYAGDRKPIVTHATPNVRLSLLYTRFQLEVKAGHTIKNDFLFEEDAGREWPHKEYRTWAVGNASLGLNRQWTLGLTSGYTHLRTGNLAAQTILPGNLEWTSAFGQLSLGTKQGFGAWTVSLGGKTRDLRQQTGIQKELVPLGSISNTGFGHSKLELDLGKRSILSLSVGAQNHLGSLNTPTPWSYFSKLALRHTKASGGLLEIVATLGSDVSNDLLTTQNLVVRGASLGDWATGIHPPPFITRANTREISLYSSSFVRPDLLLWISLRGRTVEGLTAPERTLVKDEFDHQFLGATSFKIGQSGHVVSPSVGFVLTRPKAKMRFSYQYSRLVVGENLYFWKHFVGLSPHQLTGSISVTPASRFHLFVLARMGSQTVWPDYNSKGYGTLPRTFELEGTLSKELWRDNMRVSLSFLNVLDTSLIRHPAGVDEQFAVRLGVFVRFSDSEASAQAK